jgi:hypothetical protein
MPFINSKSKSRTFQVKDKSKVPYTENLPDRQEARKENNHHLEARNKGPNVLSFVFYYLHAAVVFSRSILYMQN